MNTSIDSCPPPVEIVGGWTCESIAFFCHAQAEKGKAEKVSSSVELWYPADADAVVEQQIQTGNEEDPFWCYLWPTARALAQQVFKQSSEFSASQKTILGHQGTAHPDGLSNADAPSLQVLETGCGIGLVGLAALAAGATTVTFQDLRSRSVALALHNAQANGFGDRALGETFDWQSSSDQTFDWIVASDVLYHTPAHKPLLDFLEGAIRVLHRKNNASPNLVSSPRLLHQPLVPPPPLLPVALAELPINGAIWIGDPGRRETETFIQLATPRFQIHLFDAAGIPLATPTHGEYQLLVMYPRF